jgi:hypothetical protein
MLLPLAGRHKIQRVLPTLSFSYPAFLLPLAVVVAAVAAVNFDEPAPANGKNGFGHFLASPAGSGASGVLRRYYSLKQHFHVADVAMYSLVGTRGGLRLKGAVDMHHAQSCLNRKERVAVPTRGRCIMTGICVHAW